MRVAACLLAGLMACVGHAQEARKYALLIGVKDYDHDKLESLPFAERDVAELKPVLERANYQVRLLTVAAGERRQADRPTLANIQRELVALLGRAETPGQPGAKGTVTKRDLVLIALAGHGLQPSGDPDSYFCPVDANPSSKTSLLSVGELIRSLDRSGAGTKLLLVDACRNDPDPSRGRGLDGAAVQSLPQGVAALFSCSPGQRAFETAKAGGGHGVFFHFILEGLRGKAANERGEVTWSRLSEFVAERVERGVREWIGPDRLQVPCEFKNLRGQPPILLAGLSPAGNAHGAAVANSPAANAAAPKPAANAGLALLRAKMAQTAKDIVLNPPFDEVVLRHEALWESESSYEVRASGGKRCAVFVTSHEIAPHGRSNAEKACRLKHLKQMSEFFRAPKVEASEELRDGKVAESIKAVSGGAVRALPVVGRWLSANGAELHVAFGWTEE